MEILEAFDLTGSYRDAAELAGCDHHTVAHWAMAREQGRLQATPPRRAQVIDDYMDKVEEWVDKSKAKVRADIIHDKLIDMGYQGSERTTRRVAAEAKKQWRQGNRRLYRPWITEPGLWMQYDFGEGPKVGGLQTILFCAWLSWSRYRIVLPILDKTLPTVIWAIDACFRRAGGVPTYVLTDNEKTVTTAHIARIAVRHPEIVLASRHYGTTITTCMPADPESKGGAEATVRIAKADLVPTDANLLPAYQNFDQLEKACVDFCDEVNSRPHRVTRRAPQEMLIEERARLHPVPQRAYTAAFGITRTVGANVPVISYNAGEYSVPHRLAGEVVWVREHGEQVVIVHVGPEGSVEVARHLRTTPGNPRHTDEHFGPTPEGPISRTPKAQNASEQYFLGIGEGARLWLTEAAAAGASRIKAKMAHAVEIAALQGARAVDEALGHAAVMERFDEGDLDSILAHRAVAAEGPVLQATEDKSLQPGTRAWEGFGK